MIFKMAGHMLKQTDKRLLFKFMVNFGWKGKQAVSRFQKRLRKGEFFPAFIFISVTDQCNLSCQGCWVASATCNRQLDTETLDTVIRQSKKNGTYFFGILGGEPLLHKGLFQMLEKHPECYFLLFTNGTLITGDVAVKMNRLGNVSPLISIEGNQEVSDTRRGGTGVYQRTISGLRNCRQQGLITGVATSVCKSNIDDLATEAFVRDMVNEGVHYLWYYIYRPVGPDPSPELALTEDEIVTLRQFMVDIRKKAPLLVVDAYWDHLGRAMCPAAVGMAHHIGPGGDIEPCPPIQFAKENVGNGENIAGIMKDSSFLRKFRELASTTSRGCILMEHPRELIKLVKEEGAHDSSGRNSGLDELAAMKTLPCHHVEGREIPETNWMYRFAKKHWFFGFGAYG